MPWSVSHRQVHILQIRIPTEQVTLLARDFCPQLSRFFCAYSATKGAPQQSAKNASRMLSSMESRQLVNTAI
uniref:Uncharacterized protein n=1 Tax=Phlebotomus papatasi TaxID=29031 RepID=A0A1B0DAQ2_PHLPP